MNTTKLFPALLEAWPVLFLIGLFIFAIGSVAYMIGVNFYRVLKPYQAQELSLRSQKTPHNLLAAAVFFALIGILATVVGIQTWLQQQAERGQAAQTIIAALWFLHWRSSHTKKTSEVLNRFYTTRPCWMNNL